MRTWELLPQIRRNGEDSGICYLCGIHTADGHAEAPSSAFTAWADCYEGDVICPGCYGMLKDRSFRSRSWWITKGNKLELMKETQSQFWERLLDPPEPPFAVYVTQGHQKQGWITGLNYVSQSRQRYTIAVDWLDNPTRMDCEWVQRHAELLDALRKAKIPKANLLDGQLQPYHYKRLVENDLADRHSDIRRLAGNPQWEVMIVVHS